MDLIKATDKTKRNGMVSIEMWLDGINLVVSLVWDYERKGVDDWVEMHWV